MASWTLSAVLCLIVHLTFLNYVEGQPPSYNCNDGEKGQCKFYAREREVRDCKKNNQHDCNPMCYYTNGDSETHCPPPNQACTMDGVNWGICKEFLPDQCGCEVRTIN